MNPPALEWSFNPWRDRPVAAGVGAVMSLALCLMVAALPQPLMVRLVLSLSVLGALSPALAPSRCRVDDAGVEKRGPFGTVRRPWGVLRRAATWSTGVMVSPYPRPHWLEHYRGVVLPLPANGRDALRAALTDMLRDHGL